MPIDQRIPGAVFAKSTPRSVPAAPPQVGRLRALFALLSSSSAAFLLLFPTIGYYTLAAYVNALAIEGSAGGFLIRAVSLTVLLIAFLRLRSTEKRTIGYLLLPGTAFILIYGYRLLENMLFLGLDLAPGNDTILLFFFGSSVFPAYILAKSERMIREEDMRPLLSAVVILFLIGMALNRDALAETAERRMMLYRVNPIALAYVASSLMLFYLLTFGRSRRARIEALIFVPFLLVIASLARSRGMLIASGVTLAVYLLVLPGTRKIKILLGLASAAALVGYFASEYVSYSAEALNRIDVENDRTTLGRSLAFRGAWEQFTEDPVFGRYAFEFTMGYYPHNIYLESLMAVGLFGTVPFAVHLGMAIRGAIGLIREPESSLPRVFIALLFVRDAVGAAASGGLWGASGFWITSFVVIAMWYGRQRDLVGALPVSKGAR